jgi:uncharacterized membrane protein
MIRQRRLFFGLPIAARPYQRLLHTPEGNIFLLAIALVFLYCALLSVGYLTYPVEASQVLAVTVANVVFGRAAGMSLGYAMGFGHIPVVPLNMFIESILVLFFYPLFVFSWRKLVEVGRLGALMERTREAAERHGPLIRRFGIPGLFVFVWIPFWMTGPLVGCVIGFLMGFRTWVNLSIVLCATYLAIVSWALLLKGALTKVAMYGEYAPMALVTSAIAVVTSVYLVRKICKGRKCGPSSDNARRTR